MGYSSNRIRCIMVQGTSSSSGKSTLVTALCRILADLGYRVAPFKSQNMSSNVYTTRDGLEMAHAQALQAFAARVEPDVHMNPILLKPMGDYLSKVVVLGREYRVMHARDYYRFAIGKGLSIALSSLKHLSSLSDVVVIEGAGSPAEINIARYDIANMRLAEAIDAPVLIVSDIERGGCFASMLGTLMLLRRRERELVRGFIINKFRGDRSILAGALARFERMSGKRILGVVPFVGDLALPEEDSLSSKGTARAEVVGSSLDVMIDRLSRVVRDSIAVDEVIRMMDMQ
ncbi:MAG: cobyric acid synthase [Candidatus Nitrosocaldus sp.]|nr:cobyric acid synthase [Candidatus Nitrosocaldus sp.]MDW7999730.1 cobyric acid synthase [Candidatus Nitrosocaldus sp.]